MVDEAEPRLSVTVTSYRRAAGLERLLTALRPQVEGFASREIVVVNDGSHDDAYQQVASRFADIAAYHPLPQNVGIARARNEVAARARGSYIVFTDDDCEPPAWWLDWLEARLDTNPELDLVIGTTLPNMGERPRFIERVNGHYKMIPEPHGTPSAPLFVTANVAIRRSLFERLGGFGFGGAFPGAGEDTELACRLGAAGALTVVDHNWYVRHDVSDGVVTQMRRFWRYGYSNVWMVTRLTTAPSSYLLFTFADRRKHFAHAIELMRKHLAEAEGFSSWAPMRWLAAATASCVKIAYYDGCAVAAAERRRELRI
jgi:glycosyltransferase involved in cell wall biosynthesis